jgi:hypothetical protein
MIDDWLKAGSSLFVFFASLYEPALHDLTLNVVKQVLVALTFN